MEAVLAYEDRFFGWHPGVNPFALLRAAGQWLWHAAHRLGRFDARPMQVARDAGAEAYASRSLCQAAAPDGGRCS